MLKTEAELRGILDAFVSARGPQVRAAEALGVSRQHLNDVLHGRRGISLAIYGGLGYTREVVYRPKEEGGDGDAPPSV